MLFLRLDDWPLYFRTASEAAELVTQAMDNYDYYASLIREWMAVRFGEKPNFPEVVQEIWREYTLDLGDKLRLVTNRGDRKSL